MTDFIIKNPAPSIEELKARGAVIIDDSQPGTGFADDVTDLPEYQHPAVLDAEKRAQDAKPSAGLEEAVLEARESNTDAVRLYRFRHQEDYTGWVPGRILKIGDFLGLLQTIRPDAFVAEHQILGLRGLGFVEGGKPVYSGTSVQDVAPEWSQLRIDAHGLPTREKYRGWRTVLLTLIKKQIITEEQCDKVFGKPTGPRSRPWYRSLYEMRNGKCGECRKERCDCGDRWDFLRADAYQYSVPSEVAAGRQQRLETNGSQIWMPR